VEQALARELEEELCLEGARGRYVTDFSFVFGGFGRVLRYYYEVRVDDDALSRLKVREGREMRAFSAAEILTQPRVVAYDSFAIWMHARGLAADPGGNP
jgi:8-oxo-dGTP pyrophosphatase MutT (NUDIX family)